MLDILETLKEEPSGARLADLARTVEMPKATVYRIMTTLEGRGYVDRVRDGGYCMARKFFDLKRDIPVQQLVIRAAQPLIERLVESCKETVNLGILDAGEVVVVNTVESPQSVRMSSKVGNRRHLHTTAIGKVLLAGLNDREVLRLIRLKGLPKLTPNSIVTKAALMAELNNIREVGFALDDQENEMDGRCIGASIKDADGRAVAALSISAPVFRMDVARANSLVGKLRDTCEAVSRGLAGYQRN